MSVGKNSTNPEIMLYRRLSHSLRLQRLQSFACAMPRFAAAAAVLGAEDRDRDTARDNVSLSISCSWSCSGSSSCMFHAGLLSVLNGVLAFMATSFSRSRSSARALAFSSRLPFSLLRALCKRNQGFSLYNRRGRITTPTTLTTRLHPSKTPRRAAEPSRLVAPCTHHQHVFS